MPQGKRSNRLNLSEHPNEKAAPVVTLSPRIDNRNGRCDPGYIGTTTAYPEGGCETDPTSSSVTPAMEPVLTGCSIEKPQSSTKPIAQFSLLLKAEVFAVAEQASVEAAFYFPNAKRLLNTPPTPALSQKDRILV